MEKRFVKFAQKFVGVVFASILLALSLMLSSCGEDSGLGATIDAKAPKLEITYPAESGIAIRDSFILYGTCSDDKSVARVAVSVKSLEKSEGEKGYADDSFLAEVSADSTTWSITLNDYDADNPDYFNGWRYADGKYEVSATCYDNAGNNSGTYSKTFEIDNTPPVFIISNPGVVKSKNLSPSAYGSIFTIDGTISDNHTISTMDVAIYDESGSLVSHETYDSEQIDCFREEEISTAGGTSVTIAQYAETSTTAANTRYSDIYGSDSSAGTKYYYASVTLSDSAQVYQNPTGSSPRSAEEIKADERGNETSKLYLYDDVYSSLMSTKKGLGLNASNLKDIISGITVNEDALEILTDNVIDTASAGESDALANKLSFSLNPEANPVYNVNGFEFAFSDNDTLQTASSGNMVSVTITAGLDNTNIAPEVVRVWMKEYSEKPSESDEDKIKADLLALEKDVESLEDSETDFIDTIHADSGSATSVSTNNSENDWILIYDYSLNNSKGSSVSTKTFSVTLPEGISLSKYYILGVTGYDIEEVEFSQNTVYGFEGNTAGVAPTLTIDSPDSLAIFGEFDSSSVFTGKATLSTNQLYISEISATLSITDESSSSQASVAKYTDSIKWINDWGDSTYGAISWDETSSTWKFDASKIQELVDLYNSKKDDGIYWLCTLTVEAKSSSGHSGEISRSIHIDTVAPTVTINSVTPNVSGAEYFGESDTNTYLNGKITFKGTIEEQNLDSVSFDILAGGESVIEELGISGELGKVYSVSKEIDTSIITEKFTTSLNSDPKIEVEIRLTAMDKAGNSATYSSKALLGGEQNYVVYQETDRPKISLGNADATITSADDVNVDTNLFGTTSNNKLSISFEDDDAISKYEVYLYESDGTTLAAVNDVYGDANPYSATPKKTTASLNYLLPETEGVYQVKVVAYDSEYVGGEVTAITDAFRKTEVGNFFIAVDSGAPTLSVDSVAAYVSTTDSITGTVSPSAKSFSNGTSISAVFLDSELQKLETQPATLSATTDGTSWAFPLSALPSNASQNYILKITAKDKYQQESSTNVTFKMDPIAPTITEPTSEQTVKLDESSYVTLNVVVSDDDSGSGLSTVGYYLSDVNTAPSSYESVSWNAMNQTNDDWRTTFDISSVKNEDGDLYAFFGAKDNAGNTKVSASSIKLTIDKTAPAITVTGFDGSAVSANGTSKTTSGNSFSVTVTDTNVASLSSSNASVSVGSPSDVTGGKTYPITVSWSSTDGKIEDSQNVTFTATDANGRTATYTVTLSCDNSAPVVTLDDYDEYASSSVELTGTVSDTNFTKTSSNFKVYLLPADSTKTTKSGIVTFGDSDTSWSATFTGLEETSYDIVVVAKDSFGNSSAYRTGSVSVPSDAGFTGEALAFTGSAFKVDVNAPELTENSVTIGTSSENASQTENFYYNGGSDSIYISGQATDLASGIDSVVILPYSKTTTDGITATYDSTSGTFTATIANSKITKSGTIYAKITDNAGNSNEVNLVAITYDATAPKIQSYALSDNTSVFTAYNSGKDSSGNAVYYVNNSTVNNSGHTFTLSGIATDNLGLASAVLSINGTNVDEITDEDSLSSYSFTEIDLTSYSSDVTAKITLTDKAGNTAEQSFTIKLDTAAPQGSHDTDSANQDYIFRIGSGTGGKYSAGTYGNASTIQIRGYFNETGSGTNMIYYKLFSGNAPKAADAKTFLENYESSATGYFSPLSSEESADVSSSADNTTKNDVKTNFKSNISGFQEGNNYLLLVAVDNVGNAALDTVTYEYTDESSQTVSVTGCYSINVDTTTPVFDKESESILTNGKGEGDDANIVIDGYVTDAAAGINSVAVSVTVGTSTASATVETEAAATDDDANRIKWTATLAKSAFSSVTSGTYTVYAKAIDKAGEGNSQTVAVANVTVDKIVPTVTLTNPDDADSSTADIEINGTIGLSGTIKDANTLPDTAITGIQVSKDNSTWTSVTSASSDSGKIVMDSFTFAGNYTFTVSGFDTTKLDDETTYYIRAVAVDTAGNTGYSDGVQVKVSQDTDRPNVKINNLTAKSDGSFILKYGTNAQVTGTVTDDDSSNSNAVSKLIISETAYTGTGDEPTNLVSFTASTGDFTFTPSNTEDGTKTFYIYIEDNAGGIFYTTATAENYLSNPKISVKGTAAAESVNSSAFTYSSDGTNPVVNLGEGLPYASTTGSVAKDDSGNDFALSTSSAATTNATLNSSFKVGGTSRRYVKFYFTATDASGVVGMSVTFTNESGTVLAKLASAASVGDVDLSDYTVSENAIFISSSDGTSAATWTTDFIDFSTFGTGQISVVVTPYDNAGLSGNGTFSFNVDNAAPSIEVRSPSSGTEVTGSVSISGTANDTGTAGTANIQWIVPTTSQTTVFNAETSDAEKLAYLQTLSWNGGSESLADEASLVLWQFDFDGQYDTTSSDSDNFVFSAGNPLFNVYDKADFATNDDYASTGLYYLPVYFLATDALGNASYSTEFYIKHNPDADRPKLEFTYPTKDNYKSDSEQYVVLGGTIRATGSAEIPSGTTTVGAIYYQIADENGAFDSDDMTQAAIYGYTVVRAWDAINAVKGTSFTSSTTLTDAQLEDFGFASNEAFQAWWGVKANGTASWNLVLNSSGELNPSDDSSTTNITLRVCGINADGKVGAWTSGDNVIAIHVDNTAPVISGVVNQYSNGTAALTAVPTAAYTSSQTYEADMYLRGYWTLVATVVDETEVKSYSVLKGSTALTAGSGYFVESDVTDSSTGKTGYCLYIPIPKNSGSVEITINASDTDHDSSLTYSFNIDETAPTLDNLTANGTLFSSDDFESIEDDNYQFIVAGSSTDEGSGVENILFYYMRKNGTTGSITDEVVMDPMITSSTDDSKVAMSDLTARTFTQGDDEFTLYAKAYTGTATTETFTSDSAYDAHVRIGGVVEIDGILHTISAISENTVTFSPSLSAEKTSFTAYFPIAQVIDNSATEKVKSYSANPFTFEKGDDGDKMPESFSKSGKTWTWDATIHSTNMPDGPASLVILAFDSAGNVAGKTINTKITNNAPRLAKVFLGTDLSGDGKYVNSSSLTEIVEYDILGAEGATQKSYTLDFTEKQSDGTTAKYSAGTFKIKNGLAVIPELTGGNGDIGMVLNTSATSATAVTGTVTDAASSSSESADSDGNISASFTGTVEGTFKGSNASYKMHAFTVASDDLGDDGTDKGMSFTFWDSTEETTQGTDSQYSVLYVKNFTVAQTDSTKPTVVVNPFYWNSSADNSLYGNSSDNGHIELEGDLTDSIKTAYGSDPKVSGKITFTGTAYDEHKLSSLAVQFGTFLSTATSVATYDSADSSWTVASKTMDSDGYEFTVTDATSSDVGNYGDSVYFDQDGHKVYWTLSIDTSKITTVAATDVKVTVTATDASDNATDTSSIKAPDTTSGYAVTDGTTNVPVYQMDVVPYVAKVYTKLAKNKVTNWSVYNRTALGHYPVQSVVSNIDSSITLNTSTSEDVTLYGFNLNDSSAKIVSGSNTFTVGNATTALAIDNSTDGQLGFNVAKLQSGELNLTVNGITILNNMNDNNSKGDASEAGDAYKNWYNRKGNGDTNNILTDDVYFDVWEFNDRAAVPINGTATGINMEINQKTGMLNYAFANGGVYYSMGGNINNTNEYSTTNSYSSYYWAGDYDTFAGPCVGFHVDDLGYTYSVVSGGDTNTSGSVDKWVLYSSRWGILGRDFYGTLNGNNSLRLEEIALKLGYHAQNLNYSLMKYRYLSPEFASTVSGTNTNLYLVYYDALCNQIRFRAGTFSTTSKETSGGFQDEYTGGASSYYSTNNCQIIANGSSGGEFKIDDAGNTVTVPGISGRGAGQYVDVAVVKNETTDVVCAVWYDAEENNMKFSYISDPIGNWDTLKGDATAKNWTTPQTIFTEGGEYCHIVADKNNHLHIAAYAGNGDVMYAYLGSYTDTAQTCTVDASGAVGEHLTLDVAVNSKGNSIPYIGYYTSATKMPKYAYLVDPTVEDSTATFTQVADGADSNEQFTGAWEVAVVPSPSRMTTNREDKVNIGIWKNAGVLTASTTGTSQVNNSGTGYTSVNWSKTFGNGTSNGILGYQVSTSSGTGLETAQMR